MKFECLSKKEIEFVFQPSEVLLCFNNISVLEMVKNFKTIGWLIMGNRASDNNKVGIAHRELEKPLLFELESDAKKYAKMARKLLKSNG